jgi:hypothetical protein
VLSGGSEISALTADVVLRHITLSSSRCTTSVACCAPPAQLPPKR